MTTPNNDYGSGGGGGGGYFRIQPERDLAANWEVDIAKKLEEYLLKVLSGEIGGAEDGQNSVNFAEAALLLQGSVQVYSRKVEYLHSLVLKALEYLSQKRQQDQVDDGSAQPEESESSQAAVEESDQFWGLDDIAVEPKNRLDSFSGKDAFLNKFVKPPANLVVLEGDCLDANGDRGELENYLLATTNLYRDFILLDPCDSVSVDYYLVDKDTRGWSGAYREGSARKTFQSPTNWSGGTARKSSAKKGQDADLNRSPLVAGGVEANTSNVGPDHTAFENRGDYNHEYGMDDRYSEPETLDETDDEDDDPWKPLNPHEPGNFKVKPFRKVKTHRRIEANSTKKNFLKTLFPLAKLDGMINPDLAEQCDAFNRARKRERGSQSPPPYEKLRQSLVNGNIETNDASPILEENEDFGSDNGFPDFEPPEYDMPEKMAVDEDVPIDHGKFDDGDMHFDTYQAFGHEEPDSHPSLEDLCRSHLDALLASIAEAGNQTELAARVSTWKQKIEHDLEDQDQRPPFDIHEYGERILNNLSLEAEADNDRVMSFTELVKGQEKHGVARHFSALLQLVNNGDVDLEKSGTGKSVCYTDVNPFRVRLLRHEKRQEKQQFRLPKKRVKSPIKACAKGDAHNSRVKQPPAVNSLPATSSQPISHSSLKAGKIGGIRRTPDGKRRRRSRLVQPVGLNSSG